MEFVPVFLAMFCVLLRSAQFELLSAVMRRFIVKIINRTFLIELPIPGAKFGVLGDYSPRVVEC